MSTEAPSGADGRLDGLKLAATLASPAITQVASDAAGLEALGYRGLWVGEGRMRRDGVTSMTLAAQATSRAYVASGIVPFRTRHVTVLAMTYKSLWQLAPGRVRLGLGAWWEPIASKAGLHTGRPLTAMREVVTVLRELFAGHTVTFKGEYVNVDGIVFDGPEDEAGATYPVPIYLGAVGDRMLNLAGTIADGVLLDFFVPADYTTAAVPKLAAAAAAAGRPGPCDRPQLVACCCDDRDPLAAVDAMRVILTRYLAQQPHIAKHSGADPELVARLRSQLTWPASTAELEDAARLVSRDFVRSVAAVGTTTEVVDALLGYRAAGATEIVVAPFGPGREGTFRGIARACALPGAGGS